MSNEKTTIEVVCSSCQTTLLVNTKTGLVLHSSEKKSDYTLETGLAQLQDRKQKSDELFDRAFEHEKQRQQNLEDKFKQALESKDELDEPLRPWDFD